MAYYSTMRKKEILPLVTTWMDLEGIMLSEISQRERQILHGIIYMWNLEKKKKKKKETKTGTVGKQLLEVGGIEENRERSKGTKFQV